MKVLIVDDQTLIRDGLVTICEHLPTSTSSAPPATARRRSRLLPNAHRTWC